MTASHALRRVVVVGGSGLLGVVALAGCAPTVPSATAPSGEAPSGTAPSGSGSAAPAADLRDGTYSATGDYRSPGGPSAVKVTVTLAGGSITAVQVVPAADDATARQYEAQFAGGIGAAVVGKPITGLEVGAVAGSSLTAQGFEQALAKIRAQAAT